ncbi:hypothetical protein [Anaerovorax odorimutans]|uniref:hypothetical protein n=1 Tax=Anaerovorax odorimutans TaxID=109327 RepID=UPI000428F530|nr:hypothetical protein [Anaerovorax odorimutans]
MKKILVLLVIIILMFTLFGCSTNSYFGPNIDKLVFVKNLIYSEDMDVYLYYIAPKDFDKDIKKIQIPNAPEGIDCVLYQEQKVSEGKYTVGTVQIGINCDYWNEETGIGNDLEINNLLITWGDESQTTENVGSITVTSDNMQCNKYMHTMKDNDVIKKTYTLTKDTEITGLDFPYHDEVFNFINNITINDIPLEKVSEDSPIKLKKNETCVVEYNVNDENNSKYGNVIIRGFLMGKNKDKIVCFTFNKSFKDAGEYLKNQSQ